MTNPYSPQSPVFEPESFFGRGQELEEIAVYLRGNQSVSLVGPEMFGRTSLLLRLAHADARVALGLGDEYLLVAVNSDQLASGGPNDLFGKLGEAVLAALSEADLPVEPPAAEPSKSGFEAVVRRLNQRGLKLVILLDDFEHLAANPEVDRSFYNALRSAAGRFQLAFVTTSAKPLIDLTYAHGTLDILSSPFFNIFAAIRLGPLSEDEARLLVSALRSPEREAAIVELVGGHPWALQLACDYAWETGTGMDAVSLHVSQSMAAYFQRQWEHLSEDEQRILKYLADDWVEQPGTTRLRVALRDLMEKGVLLPETGSYRFASATWRDFVANKDTA